ncbi:DUF6049 family protein [Corynebacterium gerontici]|uniref:Secreted protein n=1 Tax=Corynebacterium gerontici TaxID=2079234 RepID=A0A3G6J2Y0_9CORY|nr:DUF6049 family protein [Corynebacterium gerontici]AZA12421.1 hypothetical protein CGERO_10710 [Corynebacterium gerontici]
MNLRITSAGVALGVLIGSLNTPLAAMGEGLPVSPNSESTKQRWINPNVREVDAEGPVRIELLQVPTSIKVGEALKLRVKVSNNGDEAIEKNALNIVVRHADAEDNLAQTRTVLAGDASVFPYSAQPQTVEQSIAPKQSVEIDLEVPTAKGQPGGLAIDTAGEYPILVGLQDASKAWLSTQRFLSAFHAQGQLASEDSEDDPPELSAIVPLSMPIDAVGGETGEAPEPSQLLLQSENLADALADDGQMQELLKSFDAFSAAYPEAAQATCLGIDPELLRTVQRMSRGYMVASKRPSVVSQKQRLRDSWGDNRNAVKMEPGQGQQAASDWLGHLRAVAQETCTLALPWANAELNAVQATNNEWLMREALQRGQLTLERILGTKPLNNVVVPGSGYIAPPTTQSLGWADEASIPRSDQFDPLGQAWFQEGQDPNVSRETSPSSDGSRSSLEEDRALKAATPAPIPAQPVRALVADNTVWGVAKEGTTARLAQGIFAKTYPGSLTAMLGDATDAPPTYGYGNYDTRFDARSDSLPARIATASAAIELETHHSDGPLMLMLPTQPSDPKTLLNTMGELLERGEAKPQTVEAYLRTSGDTINALNSMPSAQEGIPFGAPFDDPTVFSDTEINRARQQADYIDDFTHLMVPDPAVAIGPYSFTAPLRREVLRALSVNGRQSIATFDATVDRETKLLDQNRDTLTELRSSVTLLPPGNVYTRWSDSSPLLIAARNGLPLPVDARIRYAAPPGASIDVDDRLLIPAKGSITAQMTANLPTDAGRTDIDLWLATPSGAAISKPVTIGVQTRSGLLGAKTSTVTVMALLLVLIGIGVLRKRKARRSSHPKRTTRPPRPPHTYAQGAMQQGQRQQRVQTRRVQRRPRRDEEAP